MKAFGWIERAFSRLWCIIVLFCVILVPNKSSIQYCHFDIPAILGHYKAIEESQSLPEQASAAVSAPFHAFLYKNADQMHQRKHKLLSTLPRDRQNLSVESSISL